MPDLKTPIENKKVNRIGNQWYRVASAEMQGYRKYMEDAMTVKLGLGPGREKWCYVGVYDGHSGRGTSKFLQENMHERVCQLDDPFDKQQLVDAVEQLDQELNKKQPRAGSTCVFAVIRPSAEDEEMFDVIVSYTGDSRAMLVQSGNEYTMMSSDHKPFHLEERQRILGAGGTTTNHRVDGSLSMSRAIGNWKYKSNEKLPYHNQKVIATPGVCLTKARKGDRVVLYCDGLVERLYNVQIARHIREQFSNSDVDDPGAVCVSLLDKSLRVGSKDNNSALIVSLTDGSDYEEVRIR